MNVCVEKTCKKHKNGAENECLQVKTCKKHKNGAENERLRGKNVQKHIKMGQKSNVCM